MQGNNDICVSFHVSGPIQEDLVGYFRLPYASPAILKSFMAVASNTNDATLSVGTLADPDGLLLDFALSGDGTPVLFDRNDWDGVLYTDEYDVEYPSFAQGQVFSWTLTCNVVVEPPSGTAAENVTLLFFFEES